MVWEIINHITLIKILIPPKAIFLQIMQTFAIMATIPLQGLPRSYVEGFTSLPRCSHQLNPSCNGSEVENEVSSEEIIKFQQDYNYQRLILKALEKNLDEYFTYITSRGLKLSNDYDIQRIIQKMGWHA